MRKGFFKILISLIFVANLGFAEYVIEGEKIYYKDKDFKSLVFKEKETRNSEQLRKEIFYPDMESFKILDENYAIDKDSVFFHNSNITRQNSDIENVDLSTFEIINETLSKDKNNVYKWSSILTSDQTGDPLDIKTFSIIKSPNGEINYVKDKNGIYDISMLFAEKLEGIKDENTFRVLGDVYTEDKYNIYYYDVKIKNVDKSSFKSLGNGYGRDRNGIFYNEKRMKVSDISSFEVMNSNYSKDKNTVFYNGDIIKNADSSSFKIIDGNYSKDKNSVYYNGEKFQGADPETFEVDVFSYFEKDKNNIFYNGEKLKVDARTFYIFKENENFGKDSKNVYYVDILSNNKKIEVIEGADVSSFKVLNKNYAKDNNKVYYNSDIINILSKIDDADSETFTVLSDDYAKDKTNIYYSGSKLKNADVKTFKIISDFVAKDKDRVYIKYWELGEEESSDNLMNLLLEEEDIISKEKFEKAIKLVANFYKGEKENEKVKLKADSQTFKAITDVKEINGFYAIDKYRGYYIENSESSSDSFGYLSEVYYLDDLNVKNVKVLNNYYIKDDKNVYCLGIKLKEADALTFKVKNSFSSEAQDKNHKYEYCKVIK